MKLEILFRLYGSLWDLGVSSALDERLARERTRRHFAGPSSKYEVQNKLRLNRGSEVKICWRNPWDVRAMIEYNVKASRVA